ncbi:MAG: tRNA pseudouridine(38-40) synthase TruA [Lachnospiraceae bacterium]|nr:tRNA pseudouridine(38-40) synthase TruA [Lachnospiraceae bacterium]
MRNIKLTLEYDGSRYQGWQRLGKGESSNTISNKIIEVVHKMTNETVELFCGARTEVGVHAYAQTVNFKTTSDMKLWEIKQYLNRYLPMDIAVTDIEEKPERFHASLNATSKIYMYRMAIGEVPSVFDRKYTYYSFKKPDVDVMKQASLLLVGKHDFKKFSTVKKNKSTVKEIYDIDIYADGEEIQITIHANDFLHNMARMIIGTLIDIGLGNRKKEEIEDIFNPNSSVQASVPCDPKGLYLQEVLYN